MNHRRLLCISIIGGLAAGLMLTAQATAPAPDSAPPICVYETFATWTPDDKALVFYRYQNAPAELATIDLQTRERTLLTDDLVHQWFPLFSHHGDQLAFASDEKFEKRFAGADLFIADFAEQEIANARRITDVAPGELAMSADWSLDDRHIVYHIRRREDRRRRIAIVDVAKGESAKFSPDYSANDRFPVYTPDGASILFVSGEGVASDLWIADADGSNRRLFLNLEGEESQPRYSPDGNQIVFVRNLTGERNKGDLYIMNADGSHLQRLTDHPASEHNPLWSRDGARISFTSYQYNNVAEIFTIRPDGSDRVNITQSSLNCPDRDP